MSLRNSQDADLFKKTMNRKKVLVNIRIIVDLYI